MILQAEKSLDSRNDLGGLDQPLGGGGRWNEDGNKLVIVVFVFSWEMGKN